MTSYCEHEHTSPDDPLFSVGVCLTPDSAQLSISIEGCPDMPGRLLTFIASSVMEDLAELAQD